MSTWISLHRKIQNNPLWTEEKFSKGQAWVDLLLLADYKTGVVPYGKLFLSERWKWSRDKVTRFLEELERENMVALSKTRGCAQNDTQNKSHNNTWPKTLVTIEKWAFYQQTGNADKSHNKSQNKSQNKSLTIINNNIPPATKALEGNNEELFDGYSDDPEVLARMWRESNGKT